MPAQEPVRPSRRQVVQPVEGRRWSHWLGEPKFAVWFALVLIVVLGGGRKLLRGWRLRRAVERLDAADLTAADVAAAAEYGRDGLIELFQVLGTGGTEELRAAAGHALSVLWARDELVDEEEKALIRRGYEATWVARRRYPRDLKREIPIAVVYGVPFLRVEGGGIAPDDLEWSHAIEGARRAALEEGSPWKPGPGRHVFTLIPGDFPTNGPHTLVLKARVRTRRRAGALGKPWEIELPPVPLRFEFDPQLRPEALFALVDAGRAGSIAQAIRLEVPGSVADHDGASFLDLGTAWAWRRPPEVVVATPLPCDLAHALTLEIEGISEPIPAGGIILSGQGTRDVQPVATHSCPLGPIEAPETAWSSIDRPGIRRVRAILTPDPDRGWGDPAVRSIWPESIITDWVEAEIVRR